MLSSPITAGSATAFGCIAITVLAINFTASLEFNSWYVPVSWLAIGISVLATAIITINHGWTGAISFVTTYTLISLLPQLTRVYIFSVDVMCTLWMGSTIIAFEFICIATGALLWHSSALLMGKATL